MQPSIVIAESGGKLTTLYVGLNSTEAESVFDKARVDAKYDSVALFPNLHPRLRAYPKSEAEQAARAEKEAQERQEREAIARKEQLAKKLADAQAAADSAKAELEKIEGVEPPKAEPKKTAAKK